MLRAWEVLKHPSLWLSSTPKASWPSWAAADAQGFAYSSEHHAQLGCPMHGLLEVILQAAAIGSSAFPKVPLLPRAVHLATESHTVHPLQMEVHEMHLALHLLHLQKETLLLLHTPV